jgi:DNA-binding response OmpR family regulator
MRKILIVEDEEILRESYRMILSTEPYNIKTAMDGEQALLLCDETEFDLILLDLMMPKVDGVAFLERYKKKSLQTSKIIILSNLSSGEELTKALSLGAYKNMVKAEVSPRQLLSLVRYELQAVGY